VKQYYLELDVHRLAAQKKQDAQKKKGAKFNPWVIGDPKEKSLPIAEKNDKRIRRELLDRGWIKTQLEDDLLLRVFDPREADDGADIPLEEIDPELQGREDLFEDQTIQDAEEIGDGNEYVDPSLHGSGHTDAQEDEG
jgi:hypothetical protein